MAAPVLLKVQKKSIAKKFIEFFMADTEIGANSCPCSTLYMFVSAGIWLEMLSKSRTEIK